MQTLTPAIEWARLRAMVADPVIQAVMVRDGVTDRDVAAAVATARRGVAVGQWKNADARRMHSSPVSANPGQAASVSKPDERRVPWNR